MERKWEECCGDCTHKLVSLSANCFSTYRQRGCEKVIQDKSSAYEICTATVCLASRKAMCAPLKIKSSNVTVNSVPQLCAPRNQKMTMRLICNHRGALGVRTHNQLQRVLPHLK